MYVYVCIYTGATLTAFIGVDGLIYQLAADECLPAFLMKKNKYVLRLRLPYMPSIIRACYVSNHLLSLLHHGLYV